MDPLDQFSAPVREWFSATLGSPTEAQAGAWRGIAAGEHVLVVAPTGSGKTLAAFLWAIDRLLRTEQPAPAAPRPRRCSVLYVSPLKALATDVERNLRVPLAGARSAAAGTGTTLPEVRVGVRTGDTPPAERRAMATRPPDVLITTPESLYLVLTSAARAGLAGVQTVIVDEIHAMAGTKRGAHLALSLERLDELLAAPAQRIGLSATVRPPEAVADFLAGQRAVADGGRPVRVVAPSSTKLLDVRVAVPVPDLTALPGSTEPVAALGEPVDGTARATGQGAVGQAEHRARSLASRARASVWPHIEERVVDLVTGQRSTIVFTNSRRVAERLTARMNEIWAARHGVDLSDQGTTTPAELIAQSGATAGAEPLLARAHHGSMSQTERARTETDLKEGRLPAVVATSSLELGIDMGAVDLVVQVGAPPSVASGMQRIGRAGHQVGAVSHGVVFPTHRGDLLPAAVIAQRMRAGQIERVHTMTTPLDVLAQQIVAMAVDRPWRLGDLAAVLRRAAPFATLGEATLTAVLTMLAGQYPGEEFGELRARIVWDRAAGVITARPGAQRLAVTSGGTIPDRGLYGVFLPGPADGEPTGGDAPRQRGGRRVGELDEEMVYESRVGDTITLGSSTWRIEEITTDRVLVSPAPGAPGRLPFWKGDNPGRPAELGRAIGAFVREQVAAQQAGQPAAEADGAAAAVMAGLDDWAADNLRAYLSEQAAATGRVPDDRTVVVERFRDELGDWRVVIHSPYGGRVHTPWAMIVAGRLRDRLGDVSVMPGDDGIALRLPDLGGQPRIDLADLVVDPEDVAALVRGQLTGSALFAARFREAAARSLLLTRRRPDARQPLWLQRRRSAQLLAVAVDFPDFPVVMEAVREVLQDDFDIAALHDLMTRIAAGQVQVVEVATPSPSPFAQSLLFGYSGQFMYDDDAPVAERRLAALTLDATMLAELLGTDGPTRLTDLLDAQVVERTGAELQHLTPGRAARRPDDLVDLLRALGPLTAAELTDRTLPEHRQHVTEWLPRLQDSGQVMAVALPGLGPRAAQRWAAVEDAARLRDALGVTVPPWVDPSFTVAVADPWRDLMLRHARTHTPFTAEELAGRFGATTAAAEPALRALVDSGHLVADETHQDRQDTQTRYCHREVLRTLRRRSLAALRSEVEPVGGRALGAFLPRWQGVGALTGSDGLLRAVEQLAGAVVPASALESLVLPCRVGDYRPQLLDELTATGSVLWAGHGTLAGRDGLVSLHLAEEADLTLPEPGPPPATALHEALLGLLADGGAYFLPALHARLTADGPAAVPADRVLDALWDLVWAGLVSNDSVAALRSWMSSGGSTAHPVRATARRARPLRRHAVAPSRSVTSAAGLGRWALLPSPHPDATVRAHAWTEQLLDRYGVVTSAVVGAEGRQAQYRDVYRVLSALEEAGKVRRGYFVEHLGASQFAVPAAVEELRSQAGAGAVVLAATDPANPYGAALPWPEPAAAGRDGGGAHRAGRKPGAVVVLVDGALGLFVERGGRTVLSFDSTTLSAAAGALASAVASGSLGRVTVQRADGERVPGQGKGPLVTALLHAGFTLTPGGLRLPVRR